MSTQFYTLTVTEIGEYIRHSSCERRFKLEFEGRKKDRTEGIEWEESAINYRFMERFFNPIDPVLRESGVLREDEWDNHLQRHGYQKITSTDDENMSWQEASQRISTVQTGQKQFIRGLNLEVTLGSFKLKGTTDFLIIDWIEDTPILKIIEAKASRRDRTHHRIQLTLYKMMLIKALQTIPLEINGQPFQTDGIQGAVIRIDEETNKIQDITQIPNIEDLSLEESDINRLLDPEGPLYRIINIPLDDLEYKLDVKCDGCRFNVNCFPESSINRRLELLNLNPTAIRALNDIGIDTIDDLADLEITPALLTQLMSNPSFNENLDILRVKARSRRSTLPRGGTNPDGYQVEALPYRGYGQLPKYEFDEARLIRVYLAVDYDYVENRVLALIAHITSSEGKIKTVAEQDEDKKWNFHTDVYEIFFDGQGNGTRQVLSDEPIIQFIPDKWTGDYNTDSGAEKQLIQKFFTDLIDKIQEVARGQERAPIHFYVWSRREMTHLIEACSRVDSRLLSCLRELMGCRETLEQLIFSSLQNEVDNRYGLGWTGRGLGVATSLFWYGDAYHWTREINGQRVRLEIEFTQDIFDFKTDLWFNSENEWTKENAQGSTKHKFEIRSRFNDGLTVPYWYAYWRKLENDTARDGRTKAAIERYKRVKKPGYLKAFLKARIFALRWVEEKISKNYSIDKPLLTIPDLPDFSLHVTNISRAAIDFLRLDHHIRRTDWIATHLLPPLTRIQNGISIPVRELHVDPENDSRIIATIFPPEGQDLNTLSIKAVIAEGSFIRLTPCTDDLNEGQSLITLIHRGLTCVINNINWSSGRIELDPLYTHPDNYSVPSYWIHRDPQIPEIATIDESITDFVSPKVDLKLQETPRSHVYDWFNPETPTIPELRFDHELSIQYSQILEEYKLPNGSPLDDIQIKSIIEGLDARIQLLQGPPGTGKTVTTAIAIILRILARRNQAGNIILLGTNTHTAINNLLKKIEEMFPSLKILFEERGYSLLPISIGKVHSSKNNMDVEKVKNIIHFYPSNSKSKIKKATKNGIRIIGGTTSALIKMVIQLNKGAQFRDTGFSCSVLIIDEASMLVFPHFLALSTLLDPDGEIMLAGDHRQLAPIVAQDWESEERPPIITYQPYVSAYQAIQNIARQINSQNSILLSQLNFTFRLPPQITQLLSNLYKLDEIELKGLPRPTEITEQIDPDKKWELLWNGETGLYLITHSDRTAHKCNPLEADIVQEVLDAGAPLNQNSIAIETPHRAQKSLLQIQLVEFGEYVTEIETIERLQGGEQKTVIMSACVSDPTAISNTEDFTLDLNRSNVAFSRSIDRLIVICSEELINYIPMEYEHYEEAILWKYLRNYCSVLVSNFEYKGKRIKIFTFDTSLLGGT